MSASNALYLYDHRFRSDDPGSFFDPTKHLGLVGPWHVNEGVLKSAETTIVRHPASATHGIVHLLEGDRKLCEMGKWCDALQSQVILCVSNVRIDAAPVFITTAKGLVAFLFAKRPDLLGSSGFLKDFLRTSPEAWRDANGAQIPLLLRRIVFDPTFPVASDVKGICAICGASPTTSFEELRAKIGRRDFPEMRSNLCVELSISDLPEPLETLFSSLASTETTSMRADVFGRALHALSVLMGDAV